MVKKKNFRKLKYVAHMTILMALVLAILSFNSGNTKGNGGGTGDSNLNYDCGGSCHNYVGDGLNTMSASTLNPTTEQTITVTVTVTEQSLGTSNLIGVFLVKDLGVDGSMPSEDGWTIVCDPNGGTNNYVEKEATSGTPIDFSWTLKSPTDPGIYQLYARVHIGPSPLYEDNNSGLAFQVINTPSGTPVIDHTPVVKAFTTKEIEIEATITDADNAVLFWKPESESEFNELEMTKVSEISNGQWKYYAEIPAQSEEGIIEYCINATNVKLYSETPMAKVTVTDEPVRPDLMAWGLQNLLILEMVGIIAFFSIKFLARNGNFGNTNGRNRNG